MKVRRKIIQIDEELCDGCGQCVPSCAEGSLEVIEGKARVVADNLCDGLGACLGECPQGALRIVEREAEEFDEEAVEVHLAKQQEKDRPAPSCPSAQTELLGASGPCQKANAPQMHDVSTPASALSHWPIQIRLVPPTAPFLKNAHLLVVADCVPVAFPSFHGDFLAGKAVTLGCPKFDDVQSYVDKFTAIFTQASIRSITTIVMEVPCCSGLPTIVKKAMERSGKQIPLEEVVVSTRGQIIERKQA